MRILYYVSGIYPFRCRQCYLAYLYLLTFVFPEIVFEVTVTEEGDTGTLVMQIEVEG